VRLYAFSKRNRLGIGAKFGHSNLSKISSCTSWFANFLHLVEELEKFGKVGEAKAWRRCGEVWKRYGQCMDAWKMHGKCAGNAWRKCGKSMELKWSTGPFVRQRDLLRVRRRLGQLPNHSRRQEAVESIKIKFQAFDEKAGRTSIPSFWLMIFRRCHCERIVLFLFKNEIWYWRRFLSILYMNVCLLILPRFVQLPLTS